MKPRLSILRLLSVIAFCGVAFAALRSPSYLWANALFTAALAALIVALINALYSRQRQRAFWAGFLVVGSTYLVAFVVPVLCIRLLTEPLLDVAGPLGPNPTATTESATRSDVLPWSIPNPSGRLATR